ncbi:MAP3K epsilon protein kinase 1 [Ancistrocladus abbreviatus]
MAEVSGLGGENGNSEVAPRLSLQTVSKKIGSLAPDRAASTSGPALQMECGLLSVSGVLNDGSGSAMSSDLLSNMVSTMNADITRGYVEKVVDLLLEFAQADTTVKSYMSSQSLLTRLFHMFNRVEPPILLKVQILFLFLLTLRFELYSLLMLVFIVAVIEVHKPFIN